MAGTMATGLAARRGKLPLTVHLIHVDTQLRDTAALLRITSLRPDSFPVASFRRSPRMARRTPETLTDVPVPYQNSNSKGSDGDLTFSRHFYKAPFEHP